MRLYVGRRTVLKFAAGCSVLLGCGREPGDALLPQTRGQGDANHSTQSSDQRDHSADPDDNTGEVAIVGTVYDFRGKPAGGVQANVRVVFDGHPPVDAVRTDDAGQFAVTIPVGWSGTVHAVPDGLDGDSNVIRMENVRQAATIDLTMLRRCDTPGSSCHDCTSDADCADGDPCTLNACANGVCTSQPAPAGTPCPDSVFCNGLETCDGLGDCLPGQDPCIETVSSFCDESTRTCIGPSIISGRLLRGDAQTVASGRTHVLRLLGNDGQEWASTETVLGEFSLVVPPESLDDGMFTGRLDVEDQESTSLPVSIPINGLPMGQNVEGLAFVVFYELYVAPELPTHALPRAAVGMASLPFLRIQAAADAAFPGDTVIIREGVYYTGTPQQAVPVLEVGPLRGGRPGLPLTIRAADGESVVLDGQVHGSDTRELVIVQGSYVDIFGLELRNARRGAVVVKAPAQVVNVRRCYAHHNDGDSNFIGGAFRGVGTVRHVLFEECMAHDNSAGFEFRESPTRTNEEAHVPPKAGNIGFSQDLPESQWNTWEGWTDVASRYCTVRRCIAYDHTLLDEHSDGFKNRYGIENVFEDNIAFDNVDDGFDGVGATRCVYRGNIAFRANPQGLSNGDGNGIKIGVRGGLDNVFIRNIVFDNQRAGIDVADTERPLVYHNTTFNNGWFGIWFEGTRADLGGITLVNNLARNNALDGGQGDMGMVGGVSVTLADFNAVNDDNTHNWAIPIGFESLLATDPAFTNEALPIQTDFPPGTAIADRVDFIRQQVFRKLTLDINSPAVDRGVFIQNVSGSFLGNAPDIGAIESH